MQKIKILAISPYEGIAETISQVTRGRTDIDVTICTGNLEKGLKKAQEMLAQNNYDVIISRGGTAQLIEKNIELPVVTAPISVYDMLRSIKLAQSYSAEFIIAGYESITECAQMLCDLLQYPIKIYTFKEETDAISILQKLKNEGIELVVSDWLGTLTAKRLDMNSILVPSGAESIENAISQAVKLANYALHIKKKIAIVSGDPFCSIYHPKENAAEFDNQNNLYYAGITSILAKKYGNSSFPIFITGEIGTGKDLAAKTLYRNSNYARAPFYSINCEFVNDKKWSSLLNQDNSPLFETHVTVYFKNFQCLDINKISEFLYFAQKSDFTKYIRLIISATDVISPDKAFIFQELQDELSFVALTLPPLRDRAQDIPKIATLYINELNVRYSGQIVGFMPDAMQLLQEFSWSQNLIGLKRVLRSLSRLSNSSYINAQDVKEILKGEMTVPKNEALLFNNRIDLSKPLYEINREIAYLALSEEGMSREKAAERLGISRSTLWRMLRTRTPNTP